MAGHTPPSSVDPQALAQARTFWSRFVKVGEMTVIAIVLVLGLMAAALV